jgi:hypothetical protein
VMLRGTNTQRVRRHVLHQRSTFVDDFLVEKTTEVLDCGQPHSLSQFE